MRTGSLAVSAPMILLAAASASAQSSSPYTFLWTGTVDAIQCVNDPGCDPTVAGVNVGDDVEIRAGYDPAAFGAGAAFGGPGREYAAPAGLTLVYAFSSGGRFSETIDDIRVQDVGASDQLDLRQDPARDPENPLLFQADDASDASIDLPLASCFNTVHADLIETQQDFVPSSGNRLVIGTDPAITFSTQDFAIFASPDEAIFELIDKLLPVGQAIVVDGNDADWAGIPAFSDPDGDLPGSPSQELLESAIVPLDQEIVVLVRTAGAPSQLVYELGVQLEMVGSVFPDAQILLAPPLGPHLLQVVDETGQNLGAPAVITGLELAYGPDFFELRVPYSSLAPHFPAWMASGLDSANHRSWVRGGGFSYDPNAQVVLDYGAGASAFRFLPTPYPLDPPFASPSECTTPLEFPLEGQWFVAQGPFGALSHGSSWAYDFVIVDQSFLTSDPPESPVNSDHYSWGETIFSPAAGTVTEVEESHPESIPPDPGPAAFNNFVLLDLDVGVEARMLHMPQNGVLVSPDDAVDPSTAVGLVGNSGFSFGPHLHLEIGSGPSTQAVAFDDVAVSLNPVPDDPWKRYFPVWEPREGFFLPEPGGVGGLLSGALLLAGVSGRRASCRDPFPSLRSVRARSSAGRARDS